MPKRLIDSSISTSPSLRICSPRAQDAFHRFIVLADDFGCFEADPTLLAGLGWPFRRDVTEADIRSWLVEYAMAGMLLLWEHGGRWYAFLAGWNGPRGQKARVEYHATRAKHGSKRKTPKPPAEQGDVAGFSAGRRPFGSPVPGKPGGEPQRALEFDSDDLRSTQFQFQVQSQFQAQGEGARVVHPEPVADTGIGLVAAAFEQRFGKLLAGRELLDVREWIARGVQPQRLADAIEATFTTEVPPLSRWRAFNAMVRDTAPGEPFVWRGGQAASRPGSLDGADIMRMADAADRKTEGGSS